ncbi:MAG: D-alanine-D-alanine ligase [Candidatus Azotimanducaceae bacterium]|jgi:D-alanine-D-alanine ligase
MKLRIAVLMGGTSAEAEVSRNSASQVSAALEASGHDAHLVELDQNLTTALLELAPDVVFPALHGPPGEDGTVQGYLEQLGFAYVGSGVRGCALAMDKSVAKLIFAQVGLPVLDEVIVAPNDNLAERIEVIHASLGEKIVIKPLNQGSAIGVSLLANGGDPTDALTAALSFGPCMVEPFFMGREITVGILDIPPNHPQPHPVIEIRTASDEWYDYKNRYQAGQSEHIIPADLSKSCQQELQSIALLAHQALGLRDLSRADFIVTEEEEIMLLEVNALPGMTPTSLYPDGAAHIGFSFESLVDALSKQAAARR